MSYFECERTQFIKSNNFKILSTSTLHSAKWQDYNELEGIWKG
jgi:hypothetical protein